MKLLIKINAGLVEPQLPDKLDFFTSKVSVVIGGELYLFADYSGAKELASDYSVDDYLAAVEAAKPLPPQVIELTNVNVTGEHVTLGAGDIWWLPINEGFTLTANAQLPDMEMMIIIERVVNGSDVIDDLRAKASIVDGLITITSKFVQSGNYQITSERLNAGLEAVNAPFRLAFNKVEFDAYV
ncbi:hypothetical protein [Pseudoalteromonas sp. S558]|uniref:hypothetical protein n=1 Tax=Pseudoalteromonas sp. S558 TaxID=2066515 RepID=UPI00110C02DE|nr:hypothetical protein [Pseudoalteromonas sp. S558]TMO02936.1 hypothetical protein CWB66_12425 [Pseudoalteromonas sp. S558]